MSLFRDRDKGGDKQKPAGPRPPVEKPVLGGNQTAGGMVRKPVGQTVVASPAEATETEGTEEAPDIPTRKGKLPPKQFEKHSRDEVLGDAEEQYNLVQEALKTDQHDEALHMKRYQIVKQHGERSQLFLVLQDAMELCPKTFFATKLAALHEEDEHYDKAVELRDKISSWTPEDPDAWKRLGQISVRARDLPRAEAAYLRLLNLKPTDDNPLGTNFLDEVTGAGFSPTDRAAVQTMGLRILTRALGSRPENIALLETTARLASRANSLLMAEQCYEKLLRLKPDHAHVRTWKTELLRVYGREGEPEKWQRLSNDLITDYRMWLDKNPRDGRSWLMLGRQFMQAGHNDEAVQALKTAQSCDSQDWQSVYELGKLLIKMGRSEEAVLFYEDILNPYQSGGPERKSIRRALEKSLADLYFRLGRYKESLDIYSRDEEANTRFIAPLFEADSNFERALELYQKTIKQTPVDAEAYLKLAEFYVRRGNWVDAEAQASYGLHQCKNAYGDLMEGLCVALATAQMKQDRTQDAIATLDQAIGNAPDSPTLLYRKVKLLYLTRKPKEGAELAEQVRDMVLRQIACAPAASNLWSLLGDCNSLLGRTEDSEQALGLALQYDQMDATAWRGLGALCEKKRDLAGALDCYKRFVVLDPINLTTHTVRQKIADLETQLGAQTADPTSTWTG